MSCIQLKKTRMFAISYYIFALNRVFDEGPMKLIAYGIVILPSETRIPDIKIYTIY